MLHLAYLGEAKKLHIKDDALKLFIVRKPTKIIPQGFIHTPQLSPSIELFNAAMRWKKGDFSPKEESWIRKQNFNKDRDNLWWELYKIKFNIEINKRVDMRKALNRLEEVLKEGKEVYLFCFCKDTCKCHRILIGKYIEERGYKVNYRTP